MISIAKKAGEVLKKHFMGDLSIATKSTDRDLVTQADLESEKLIVSAIRMNYPEHAVLAEEQGKVGSSEYVWIVDPLDGTTNFAHKYPIFCVAIALAYRGEIVLSATFDPLRDEMFTAEKGQGARLNGAPIQVSTSLSLSTALVATGFPYDRATNSNNNLVCFGRIMPLVRGVRRSGSAALDLAYVACGRIDGYWEYHLKPWDLAGGVLLVTEAGGIATDTNGAQWCFDSTTAIAGNKHIHHAIDNIIHAD